MVIGERLALSALITGLYLPGIEALWLALRFAGDEDSPRAAGSVGAEGARLAARGLGADWSCLGSGDGAGIGPDLAGGLGPISSHSSPGGSGGLVRGQAPSGRRPIHPPSLGSAGGAGLSTDLRSSGSSIASFLDCQAGWFKGPACIRSGARGALPGRSTSRLVQVAGLLARERPEMSQASALLRRHGFGQEAARLDMPGMLELALSLVQEGLVLTPFSASLLESDLDSSQGAGSALGSLGSVGFHQGVWWSCGPGGTLPSPLVGVAGSRQLEGGRTDRRAAASACATAILRSGAALLTGGARGVDWAALEAASESLAPRGVVLHPWGLFCPEGQRLRRAFPWAWHLSLCPPWGGFEAGQAHQRNRLIYSLSQGVLIVGPRWKQGGTWSGAIEGLRSRLAPLVFVAGCGDPSAESALSALGAGSATVADLLGKPLWAHWPSHRVERPLSLGVRHSSSSQGRLFAELPDGQPDNEASRQAPAGSWPRGCMGAPDGLREVKEGRFAYKAA